MNDMKSKIYALANDLADPIELVLPNETEIDDEGWALIAPFGEHPKTRLFRENGQLKEQKFIQVLDNEAADALIAKENSFFGRLKRAIIGVPVFKGHGDLTDVDSKAVATENSKVKLGIVDKIRKAARGIEAHFALDNDGAEAVKAGWKFPSAFWYVLPNGTRLDAILAKPFKLISVALTQHPNISGVESLANARGTDLRSVPSREQKNNQEPDMKKLIGWLMAMGATSLANTADPTEDQVLEATKQLLTSKAGEVTVLGNEKSTLAGKVTAFENEKVMLTTKNGELTAALTNEQTAHRAIRKQAADAVADLAIHKGIITVAERDAQITALENSADFDKDSKALLAKPATHKTTTNDTTVSGKQSAALSNEQAQTLAEYDVAFKAELVANGQDPVKAHKAVMNKPQYSALAQKLLPKKTA